MNCRARYVTSRDRVSIAIAVHALRRDRPVRRLLPHIIQLEIAIVRPERRLDDPRDEGTCSGHTLSSQPSWSRCSCSTTLHPVRVWSSRVTRASRYVILDRKREYRASERAYERSRSTTSAGRDVCAYDRACVSPCVRACVRTRAHASTRECTRERLSTNVGAPDFRSTERRARVTSIDSKLHLLSRRTADDGRGTRTTRQAEREGEGENDDDNGGNGSEISRRRARFRRSAFALLRMPGWRRRRAWYRTVPLHPSCTAHGLGK